MIVFNCIACNECLDVIESIHRHDMKYCSCHRVAVDGGLDYLRRCYQTPNDYIELSVHDTDKFEIVRQFAFRTGYGKPGTSDYGKYRLTRLCDMTDDHLQSSIEWHQVPKGGSLWRLYLEEKIFRHEMEIAV